MIVTKRQKEVLDYITAYSARFGYAPTLAEIGHHFGLTSLATVHKHLKNLEEKRLVSALSKQTRSTKSCPRYLNHVPSQAYHPERMGLK